MTCSCPVHRGRDPPTFPLGVPFAGRVDTRPVKKRIAADIYAAHHSYAETTPHIHSRTYGVFLDDHLVGAMTFRRPSFPSFRPLFDSDDVDDAGDPAPESTLPAWARRTYTRDEVIAASRVCIAVEMPNLASAALSTGLSTYLERHRRRMNVHLVVSYVHDAWQGSMLKALADGGGWYEGAFIEGRAHNTDRDIPDLTDADKRRWLYPVQWDDQQVQATLSAQS